MNFSKDKDFVLKLGSEMRKAPSRVHSGLDTGKVNKDNQVNERCWDTNMRASFKFAGGGSEEFDREGR